MEKSEIDIMDPSMASISPYPDQPPQPPQQDVDDFLRKKRKSREHKACYPCRSRKVKCDLERPCRTCRDRDHPELCNYHPPNKRQNVDQNASAPKSDDFGPDPRSVTLGRDEFDFLCRKLNVLEDSIKDLRREMRRNAPENGSVHEIDGFNPANIDPNMEAAPNRPSHTDVHGVHVKNDAGEIVHLGGGSIPAMLYALQMNQGHAEQSQIQEMLGKTVLPLFGLDNESATYPFVDLWGLPHGSLARAQELAKALPSDAQMLDLFQCYKDLGYVIYAGIVSPEHFQSDLTTFLITRSTQVGTDQGVSEQTIYGKTYNWLALLFAVLASGAQCSSMPRKERELTSQVYICCSFECLRFTNFLSQSTLESVQSLLVIGNVLTNNLNAGTSWSLLGLTIRLAQGLGVHRTCPPYVPKDHVFPRSKIWWAIIWQDSLLSITYDRVSGTGALDVATMPPPQEFGAVPPYHAAMYHVSKVGLEIVRDRSHQMSPREQMARIQEHRDELDNVMKNAAPYLRDSRKCENSREMLEHWGLYLHSAYHMSELCRPAINPNADPELVKAFRQICIDNLINTVEAFLGLNNVTSFARQSWAALHRPLSSALMLGIIGEHSHNERARSHVSRFINIMTDMTNNLDPQEISAPIQRSLSALRKLNAFISRGSGSVNVDGFSFGGAQDGTAIDENGSLKLDQSAMITPSNSDSAGLEEERSPYSVLNTILWGNMEGYP